MRSSIAKLSHRVNVISVGRNLLRVHECDGTLVSFANTQNGEPLITLGSNNITAHCVCL
jgi:hypothetical protein